MKMMKLVLVLIGLLSMAGFAEASTKITCKQGAHTFVIKLQDKGSSSSYKLFKNKELIHSSAFKANRHGYVGSILIRAYVYNFSSGKSGDDGISIGTRMFAGNGKTPTLGNFGAKAQGKVPTANGMMKVSRGDSNCSIRVK
jgi:hypothetical protein